MLLFTVIVHFFADMATSIFQPLGPYLTEVFSVSNRTYAMTLYSINLTSSLVQPFFGVVSDRISSRNLYLTVVLAFNFLAAYSISVVKSFPLFVVFAFITYLANSAFHPLGAVMATSRNKKDLAYFTLSGMFGFAMGPVFITWYAQNYNLKGLEWFGVGLATLVILTIPRMKFLNVQRRKPPKLSLRGFSILLPIFLYVAFRSASMGMAQVYGPMYAKLSGLSLVIGGSMLTITRFVGMALAYSGVHIGEVIGNAYINLFSGVLMAGAGFVFSMIDFSYVVHPWSILNLSRDVTFPFLFLFVSMLAPAYFSMSSTTVEAQKKLPENAAFASSVSMGLGWSIGSLMSLVYSSVFGNDVLFMVRSIWVFAALSALFALWDVLRERTSKAQQL